MDPTVWILRVKGRDWDVGAVCELEAESNRGKRRQRIAPPVVIKIDFPDGTSYARSVQCLLGSIFDHGIEVRRSYLIESREYQPLCWRNGFIAQLLDKHRVY